MPKSSLTIEELQDINRHFNVIVNGRIAANKDSKKKKECRSPTCGAGVFMAQHKDRVYCGKYGAAYQSEQKKAK
ncbi:MAG: hypothetical protein EZS28_019548 [Streblomastix strix]|uniref:Small ribosomal subunit protein eS31 domain-containing protein n=1 Tax=Streblomastix strix TaxID=222440 RepID=A0A5J4VQY9_9EUKA|nr:MAG: hypothetical protein EZS28_019548 [Streblomastix strix]